MSEIDRDFIVIVKLIERCIFIGGVFVFAIFRFFVLRSGRCGISGLEGRRLVKRREGVGVVFGLFWVFIGIWDLGF
jgi:hypothetical protein